MTFVLDLIRFVQLLPVVFILMEPIVIVLIALAAISAFLFIVLLVMISRKEHDILLLIGTLLSFFIIVYLFSSLASYLVLSDNFFSSVEFQMLLLHLSLTSILCFIYFMVKEKQKRILLLGQIIFSMTFIASFSLLISAKSQNIISESLLTRILIYLWIVTFAVPAYVLLIRNHKNIGKVSLAALLAGISSVLLVPFVDHHLTFQREQTFELLIFASFICFIIITFILFVHFIARHTAIQVRYFKEKELIQVFDRIDVIVVVLDRMGHVEFINPYFLRLTGFRKDEVTGKDWFAFFLPSKEHYDVQGAFVEIIEHEHHPRYRNLILTKNGQEKMIDWHNIRLYDKLGQVSGSFSIGIDLTDDLIECEALKQKLKEALELIDNLKGSPDRNG